ncbi:TetR family transcriptional regulator [Sporosarcina sp.]|uniref:TetR family transcriptional regulator n=1 Tax=Sporosarcina sp. TaxID=49982 RepID=UPI00261558F8|nr:TetR family transcriptional regulator [Sporosarcina sp.]
MNKREKIVSVAIDTFIEKGIEKTTISEIVDKAGIAQGTFYLYFSSKMSLMPAIAEVLVKKMQVCLQNEVKSTHLEQQLEETIDAMFAFTSEYKELTKIMYVGLIKTEHVNDWEMVYIPIYQWMEDLLYTARRLGDIRLDINVKYVAKIIIGMIEAAAEQNYLFDEQNPTIIAEHRKELQKFVTYALGAPS